ncbi:metal-dependent hydrolase [Bacillus daqingensis]|uniref:Metal-dependent hydrolase n=1 Tax=Bacillus daqingensis TaxID=872396 RepID=A0ABV9NS43_9BACI
MRYYTHLSTACAAALAVDHYTAFSFTETAPAFTAAGLMLGAVFPDIDETTSWIGRRSRGLAFWVKLLFGHRGLTHSGIAALVAVLVLLRFDHAFIEAFCFGFVAHLTGDLFSRSGIPLFYPLTRKRTSLPVYRTGSWVEMLLFIASLVYIAYFLF